MAYEVVNRLRSTSVIRVDGASTTTLALSDLSTGANETVKSASIKRRSEEHTSELPVT